MVDQVSEEQVDFDSKTSGEMVFGCLAQQQPQMNWTAGEQTKQKEKQKDHDFDCYYRAEALVGLNTSFAGVGLDWIVKPCIALLVAQHFVWNQ